MEKDNKNKSSMHIASLVLGIISILSSLFWYISLPSGVLAIVFGVKSSRKNGSKMGKAGMVTGIVGLSLFAFMYITMLMALIIANA